MSSASRKGKSKSNLIIVLSVLGIGLLLIGTNPSETRFRDYVKTSIQKESRKNGDLSGSIGKIISGAAAWLTDMSTVRKNYLFFSVYTVSGLDEEQQFLGILNNFIPL
jgi:hypothetical protein